LIELDNGYVARPGSPLRSVDDVDHAGIRVAVAEGSPADGFLTRSLRAAQIMRLLNGPDEAKDALSYGRADVFADYTHLAYRIAMEVPGATALIGRFSAVQVAFVVPKSNAAILPSVNEFVHQMKRDGIIAEAVKHAGLRGVRPAR
jgi:polar amino acid transport system substrate-binding protein